VSENVTIRDGFTLAALAAASGRPACEVAAVAGVCERTIRRWNRRDDFQAMVRRLRDSMLSDAQGRLLATNGKAIDALAGLLGSGQENIVLGAAGRLLDMTLRVRRQVDTERELEQVKADWEALRRERPELFQRSRYDNEIKGFPNE